MNKITEKNPRGAGRKPTGRINKLTQISLPPLLMIKFKELGASKWLQNILINKV